GVSSTPPRLRCARNPSTSVIVARMYCTNMPRAPVLVEGQLAGVDHDVLAGPGLEDRLVAVDPDLHVERVAGHDRVRETRFEGLEPSGVAAAHRVQQRTT